MTYDKLVRDKIPEIIESTGKKATYRILDEAEYKEYLERKLDEEVAEFHKSKSVEELADIREVLDALSYVYASYNRVRVAQVNKYVERGGFKKRLCLIEVEEND